MSPLLMQPAYKDAFAEAVLHDGSLAIRDKAIARFKRIGFPSVRQEDWRHFPLRQILDQSFEPAPESEAGLSPAELKDYVTSGARGSHLTFVNGYYRSELSSTADLANATLEPMSRAMQTHAQEIQAYLANNLQQSQNAFELINTFSFQDGAFLFVPKDTVVEAPIHLWFLSAPGAERPEVHYPRNLILVGSGAKVQIVTHDMGIERGVSFQNSVTELHLFANANCQHMHIQKLPPHAMHSHALSATLSKGSTFEGVTTTWGGALTEHNVRVYFKGKGAHATLKALAILDGESQVHHRTWMEHLEPEGTSRQLYKHILSESARAEYNGRVHVYPHAQRSDTGQLCHNLVLSDKAKAHARPQLQIDADDVACKHGTTVGQLQDSELFYLRSRGIKDQAARTMLLYAFAEEVIQSIEPEWMRVHLAMDIHAELGKRQSVNT